MTIYIESNKKYSKERRDKISEKLTGKKPPSDEIVKEAIKLHIEDKIPLKQVCNKLLEKYNDCFASSRLYGIVKEQINVQHYDNIRWKQITKEILEDLFVDKKYSKHRIAKLYGTSSGKVKQLMNEFGIKDRTHSEQQTYCMKEYYENLTEPHLFQTDEFKEAALKTKMERYGTPYPHLNCFTSKGETEVKEFCEHVTGKSFKKHYIAKTEFDVYNEELGIALEYCGLYWHCDDNHMNPKGRQYHKSKLKLANEHGIRLITIFEDEWRDRNSQVKGFIKSIFQKGIPLRASKCSLKELPKKAANEFYETYHIQGKTSNSIIKSYGLFHEDTLVAVMSFSSHHRQGHDKTVVLSRLCFHPDYRVHGGASRLFKHMKNEFSDYDIISWSDNRWSEGNVYKSLGFELDEELAPDYSYVKGKERFAKQSMTKNKIGAAENQTEYERAKELGFARIWDCGKTRWIMKRGSI